jgi:hypothetical protein
MVATHLAVQRADREAIGLQKPDDWVLHERTPLRAKAVSSSFASVDEGDPALDGKARTTTFVPSGNEASLSRIKCRN